MVLTCCSLDATADRLVLGWWWPASVPPLPLPFFLTRRVQACQHQGAVTASAVACSRDRIRRSLRTPVRHAASGQMVGVNRATARSAVVLPVAARPTVCGHGVCVAACSALLCLLSRWRAPLEGRAGFVAWGVPRPSLSLRHRFASLCVGGSAACAQRLPVFKNGKWAPK